MNQEMGEEIVSAGIVSAGASESVEQMAERIKDLASSLTPHQVVRELDRYIIGQANAKRAVAIALRNRWRRQQVPSEMRNEIMPNNIILIGPTGVGKTEIARRLAKLAGAPFLKVEATKYTEVGYVGRDVESMVRDLASLGVAMVTKEMTDAVRPKAEAMAEERILDILVPPIERASQSDRNSKSAPPMVFPGMPQNTSVSGMPTTAMHDDAKRSAEDHELNERTRKRFREKLKNRQIEDREIEIEVEAQPPISSMQIMGPFGAGMDDMPPNLQDIIGNIMPKKPQRRKVTIKEARLILSQEEAAKLVDPDAVQKEAISRVENSGIIFLDEIDKVAGGSTGGQGGPDVSREGVQRDLLPIVEGCTVSTKYGMVRTDHVLFIASGAFHVSKPSDLIPEMQGRFPIRVELESLTEDDFVKILTIPENALLKQYTALLATEGMAVEFSEDAIRAIAKIAFEVNESVENIGARRLHTILTTLLEQTLYDVPDDLNQGTLHVTAQLVEERLAPIVRDRDLSRYIL